MIYQKSRYRIRNQLTGYRELEIKVNFTSVGGEAKNNGIDWTNGTIGSQEEEFQSVDGETVLDSSVGMRE